MLLAAPNFLQKEDSTIEKARSVFKQLIESDPAHWSPVEHMATPIVDTSYDGITHIDKYGNKWSGNLKGWLQWRQLL